MHKMQALLDIITKPTTVQTQIRNQAKWYLKGTHQDSTNWI